MKRLLISLTMVLAAWTGAKAMSYEMAREEALYLTDKMAYELNLNDQQYNDAQPTILLDSILTGVQLIFVPSSTTGNGVFS